ncbi:unnamed protein product [Nezara viridula]|uniref:Odorant receptor n=1 Tax=Nezara viridula TaxID=85310 RepID=A0A9P0HQ00_NEZVI|nr:unnamed protein product [Nezara viridula]
MSLYWFFEKVAQDEEAAGLTLQKALFKLSGVFLWDPPNKINAIYPILPMFFINIVAILNFLQVFRFSIRTLHDFTEMVLTLIVALVFASSGLKLILLHWSKNYIKELVDFLESLPRLESYKKVKYMEGVCMSYMYILIFTAIPKYCLGIMKGELPFESAWPFDTKTTAGWWIAYFEGSVPTMATFPLFYSLQYRHPLRELLLVRPVQLRYPAGHVGDFDGKPPCTAQADLGQRREGPSTRRTATFIQFVQTLRVISSVISPPHIWFPLHLSCTVGVHSVMVLDHLSRFPANIYFCF